jgi:hypothetical protein
MRVGAEQEIDERSSLSFSRAWDNRFRKYVERHEQFFGEEKWFVSFGRKMNIGEIEERTIRQIPVERMSPRR